MWVQVYGDVSNMVAETRALAQGLKACLKKNVTKLDIEADSKILARHFAEESGDSLGNSLRG